MSDLKDQTARPFDLRRGAEGFQGWAGMWRRGDAAAIPPGYFHLAENVRLQEDDIIERPGLAKIHATTLTGAVHGLGEFGPEIGRGAILLAQNSAPAISGYGIDWNPVLQDVDVDAIDTCSKYNVTSEGRKVMCVFEDALHFTGSASGVRYLYRLALPTEGDSIAAGRRFSKLAILPVSAGVPNHMAVVNDELWIGTTTGYVLRWSGKALYDAGFAVAGGAFIAGYHEKVYAFGNQQMMLYRDDEDWQAVALTVCAAFRPKAVAPLGVYLYAVGSDGNDVVAERWDGATWVEKYRETPNSNLDIYGGVDLCEWNGRAVWAFNQRENDAPRCAFVADLEDSAERAHFGENEEGRITAIVSSGDILYASFNEAFELGSPQTRVLRMDRAGTIGGFWNEEGDYEDWSLIGTLDYGPEPAPCAVDVLPL